MGAGFDENPHGHKDFDPSSHLDWASAKIIRAPSQLPRLPSDDHYWSKTIDGALEHTLDVELGIAVPPATKDYLSGVARNTLHIERIFPFESDKPTIEALADAFRKGQRKMRQDPAFALGQFQQIGDCLLICFSLIPGMLARGLRMPRERILEMGQAMGRQAYSKAGEACRGRFPEHGSMLVNLSQEFDLCSHILGRAIVAMKNEQIEHWGERILLDAA